MEGRRLSAPRQRARRRALLGLAALLLLLIAVAVASTGSVPAGAGGTRRPADRIVDVADHLFMLLMVVGRRHLGLHLHGPQGRGRERARDPEPPQPLGDARDIRDRLRPARRSSSAGSRSTSASAGGSQPGSIADQTRLGDGGAERRQGRRLPSPQFATGPVLLVLALVAIASSRCISPTAPAAAGSSRAGGASARARRRAGRDARRPPRRGGPAPGGDRRLRAHGARARCRTGFRAARPRRRTSTSSASSPTSR